MTVTADFATLLRTEVGLLRRRETRRVFDSVVHVGSLGGEHASFVVRRRDLPVLDTAVRIDVLCCLLDRVEAPAGPAGPLGATLWLTRAGSPEPYEEDVAWLAAAGTAFPMDDRVLEGCFVVTRFGWRDVRTGETRTWRRLRL